MNPETQNQTATSQAPEPQKEAKFSQEQVNSIVANVRKSYESELAKVTDQFSKQFEQLQTQMKQMAPQSSEQPDRAKASDDPPEWAKALLGRLEHIESKTSWGDATKGVDLTSEQSDVLQKLMTLEKPEDPAKWVQDKIKLFSKPSAEPSAPAPTPPQPPTTEAPNASAVGGIVNPSKLSADQVRSMDPAKLDALARKFFT